MNQKIFYNKRIVNFRERGTGKTVILLHGYLESIKIWDELGSNLAAHYRVVSIDLPGHGDSSLPMKPDIIGYMANAVKAVLDYLRIKNPILVGHSLGGYVALAFIKQNSGMTSGLCMLHSVASADTEEKKQNRNREIELIEDGKKELLINSSIPNAFANENVHKLSDEIEYAKNIGLNTPSKGIIAALEGMRERSDNLALLQRLTIPILFVVGLKDNYIPSKKIIEQAESAKNATILKLEKSGHMGFIEEYEKTVKALNSFISECI